MHIVLVEPQIPQNTGSIARTCAATGTPLHLVGKLGFEITEKRVKRAGLDYWPHVSLSQHQSFDQFMTLTNPSQVWVFSKFAKRIYYEASFQQNDALVFGSETKGVGEEFMQRFRADQLLYIPIDQTKVRSLNLSNAVSIALYEALRQLAV